MNNNSEFDILEELIAERDNLIEDLERLERQIESKRRELGIIQSSNERRYRVVSEIVGENSLASIEELDSIVQEWNEENQGWEYIVQFKPGGWDEVRVYATCENLDEAGVLMGYWHEVSPTVRYHILATLEK